MSEMGLAFGVGVRRGWGCDVEWMCDDVKEEGWRSPRLSGHNRLIAD